MYRTARSYSIFSFRDYSKHLTPELTRRPRMAFYMNARKEHERDAIGRSG
jgi:hypothetical protein